jgi:hypothetical protein
MTTLAANTPRAFELGEFFDYPVIASDIIYEGAAIGAVDATGLARPLVGGDKFLGFCYAKADNSAGAASAIKARTLHRGKAKLSVSGAVITDIGQPVYATDDNTFVFLPTGASYIGKVKRFIESGVVIVEFDASLFRDPYGDGRVRATVADNLTLDVEDNGKIFFVTVTAKVVTLPATTVAGMKIKIVNMGAYGAVGVTVGQDGTEKIFGPDIAGTASKDLINTKATSRRGDYVVLSAGHADGWAVNEITGTWATEA